MKLEEEVQLCEELKRLKEEMEVEGENGMKQIKYYWNDIKPRYEWYKKVGLKPKECLMYALLDNGIDPRNPNWRER